MLALDGHIVSHILLYDHNRFQLHCSWGETGGLEDQSLSQHGY